MIKTTDEQPLERFIFAIRNTLDVESWNKDAWLVQLVPAGSPLTDYCISLSVEGAITVGSLGQYFRSFLIKLNMIEAQLGQMHLEGNHKPSQA